MVKQWFLHPFGKREVLFYKNDGVVESQKSIRVSEYQYNVIRMYEEESVQELANEEYNNQQYNDYYEAKTTSREVSEE
jgi:hypothetical protein